MNKSYTIPWRKSKALNPTHKTNDCFVYYFHWVFFLFVWLKVVEFFLENRKKGILLSTNSFAKIMHRIKCCRLCKWMFHFKVHTTVYSFTVHFKSLAHHQQVLNFPVNFEMMMVFWSILHCYQNHVNFHVNVFHWELTRKTFKNFMIPSRHIEIPLEQFLNETIVSSLSYFSKIRLTRSCL